MKSARREEATAWAMISECMESSGAADATVCTWAAPGGINAAARVRSPVMGAMLRQAMR